MKNYQNIAIYVLPYITACAALYHIAYWGTFNVNGLAYINLSDLVKSFVQPCVYFFVIVLLSFIFNEGVLRIGIIYPYGGGKNTQVGKVVNKKWVRSILLLLWLFGIFFFYTNGDTTRWLFWAFTVSIVPIFVIDNSGFLENEFTNSKLRIHAIRVIVFLPILSFSSGKYQREMIFKNLRYQYTTSVTIDSNINRPDTLKYLGNLDNYFLMTDLSNTKIIFVRNDKLSIIQFENK